MLHWLPGNNCEAHIRDAAPIRNPSETKRTCFFFDIAYTGLRMTPRRYENIGEVLGVLKIDARKQGREWTAVCPSPAHADRNPSWWIHDEPGSEEHGKHVCFSCGFKGDLATLVAVRHRVTRAEARAILQSYAVKLPLLQAEVESFARYQAGRREPQNVARVGDMQKAYRTGDLQLWPSAARTFLQRRGVGQEQVSRWGLGYVVSGRLAQRIVIPKRDIKGELLGYSARAFTSAAESERRYLEPSSEENADRSVLFGEAQWYRRPHQGVLVVTEGAFDALVFDRVTPYAVAALSGSQLGDSVLKLAGFRLVYIATDNDSAGNAIAAKLQAALARATTVHRVVWPAGVDAVDYWRGHGDNGVRSLLRVENEEVCRAS
jgi:DNA primase